jgi:hypothetical protein
LAFGSEHTPIHYNLQLPMFCMIFNFEKIVITDSSLQMSICSLTFVHLSTVLFWEGYHSYMVAYDQPET